MLAAASFAAGTPARPDRAVLSISAVLREEREQRSAARKQEAIELRQQAAARLANVRQQRQGQARHAVAAPPPPGLKRPVWCPSSAPVKASFRAAGRKAAAAAANADQSQADRPGSPRRRQGGVDELRGADGAGELRPDVGRYNVGALAPLGEADGEADHARGEFVSPKHDASQRWQPRATVATQPADGSSVPCRSAALRERATRGDARNISKHLKTSPREAVSASGPVRPLGLTQPRRPYWRPPFAAAKASAHASGREAAVGAIDAAQLEIADAEARVELTASGGHGLSEEERQEREKDERGLSDVATAPATSVSPSMLALAGVNSDSAAELAQSPSIVHRKCRRSRPRAGGSVPVSGFHSMGVGALEEKCLSGWARLYIRMRAAGRQVVAADTIAQYAQIAVEQYEVGQRWTQENNTIIFSGSDSSPLLPTFAPWCGFQAAFEKAAVAESDGAQSPRAAANKPSAILAANLATDHAHWHVLFAQNFCHPVNIAGRGNHALLLQMAKLRPSILTAADPVGATAVLSACRDGLEKTVRALVDRHPEIVEHVYGLGPFEGQNMLHICVVQKNYALAQRLLQDPRTVPTQLAARATGSFFNPHEMQFGRLAPTKSALTSHLALIMETSEGGVTQSRQAECKCYYGELPLSFACCTNQANFVALMLESAAAAVYKGTRLAQIEAQLDLLRAKDSFGNNALHHCTIHGHPQMYDYVSSEWERLIVERAELETRDDISPQALAAEKAELADTVNCLGDTPIATASRFGAKAMFDHLLSKAGRTIWVYGGLTCKMYPIKHLEIGGVRKGALEHIVAGGHVSLLHNPTVKQFLDVRWKRFAEPIFRANLRQFLFQLLLTIINVMWPPYPPEVELSLSTILQPQVPSYTTTGRLALELSFLFMGASKFLTEFGELLDKRGSYLGGQSGATFIENFCGITWSAGTLSILVNRLLFGLHTETESYLLVVVCLACWGYSLFFCMGFEKTGPTVVMIHHMVMHDISTFFIIQSVFLIAFAQAFVILAADTEQSPKAVYRQIQYFFAVMIGDVDFSDYTEADYVITLIFHVYVILVSVCLLNVLIAMMQNTYESFNVLSKDVFDLQRIMITISVEGNIEEDDRYVVPDGGYAIKRVYDDAVHKGMMKHQYHAIYRGEPHIQIIEATNPNEDGVEETYKDFVPPPTRVECEHTQQSAALTLQ